MTKISATIREDWTLRPVDPSMRIFRGRLTLFYVSILAAALIIVGVLIYILVARALYVRVDETLQAGVGIAMTSLRNDLIRRMIANLLDNAVRHTPAGTTGSRGPRRYG